MYIARHTCSPSTLCTFSMFQVEVQVQDFNDNFPVFDDQAYSLIIPEDTAVDTPLIQVNIMTSLAQHDSPGQDTSLCMTSQALGESCTVRYPG